MNLANKQVIVVYSRKWLAMVLAHSIGYSSGIPL
jgi:hypothetical protein